MRVLRFVNSLYVWIALSVILHVAVLRWVRFEKPGVEDNLIKYEVKLLYYQPFIEEPRFVQKREEPKVPKEEKKEVVVEKPVDKEKVLQEVVVERPVEKEEVLQEVVVEKPVDKEEVLQEAVVEKPVEKEDILHEVLKKEEDTHQRIVSVPEIVEKETDDRSLGSPDVEEEPLPAVVPPVEKSSMQDLSIVMDGLREKILKIQIYPAAARKKGLQGVVLLRLELDSEGNIIALQVMRSSGHKILDRAAVSLLKKVVPYDHGTGRSIAVEIPIKYSLVE